MHRTKIKLSLYRKKHAKVVVWVTDCKDKLTAASFTLSYVRKGRDFNR